MPERVNDPKAEARGEWRCALEESRERKAPPSELLAAPPRIAKGDNRQVIRNDDPRDVRGSANPASRNKSEASDCPVRDDCGDVRPGIGAPRHEPAPQAAQTVDAEEGGGAQDTNRADRICG